LNIAFLEMYARSLDPWVGALAAAQFQVAPIRIGSGSTVLERGPLRIVITVPDGDASPAAAYLALYGEGLANIALNVDMDYLPSLYLAALCLGAKPLRPPRLHLYHPYQRSIMATALIRVADFLQITLLARRDYISFATDGKGEC
jgi:hypothetical protein